MIVTVVMITMITMAMEQLIAWQVIASIAALLQLSFSLFIIISKF